MTFDPREALTLVMEHAPHILVAVEEVGVGFKVARPYPEGVLQGEQVVVPFEQLVDRPTTRVTFHDPDAASEDFLELVERIDPERWSGRGWVQRSTEAVTKLARREL